MQHLLWCINMKTFDVVAFENKIVLYFGHKVFKAGVECFYCINKKEVGHNARNHFTFTDLEPNTNYLIEVKFNGKTVFKKKVNTLQKRDLVNVKQLGIDSTGKTLVTKELQEIFEKYPGKIIYFPEGTYLTGALFIKPNTHIKLEKGALILGSTNPDDYLPKVKSRFEGIEMMCYASLFNIGNHNPYSKPEKHNIYIYGDGEIRGGGHDLCEAIIKNELPNVNEKSLDLTKTNPRVIAGRSRGRLIQASNVDGLVIEGLTLGFSPSWNIHPIYSKNIVIANCKIQSKDLHNGDGIDPDSSENVDIFDIKFATGDDCVAIKSGKNPGGNKINKPTKNVRVFDCKSEMGHGCCIGSEMSGGVKNVEFFNCNFEKTRYGVQIKTTKKRGGYVKNVLVDYLALPAINIRCVPYNDDGESSGKYSIFKNFIFNDISLSGVDVGNFGDENIVVNHIEVKGFVEKPNCFRNITFSNIEFKGEKRIVIENSKKVIL